MLVLAGIVCLNNNVAVVDFEIVFELFHDGIFDKVV